LWCIEIGDAVHAQDDNLAVDHEAFLPVLERSLNDPGIALGLIITDQSGAAGTLVALVGR
jgi:hypothetical protein